jgi:hypothetical protein
MNTEVELIPQDFLLRSFRHGPALLISFIFLLEVLLSLGLMVEGVHDTQKEDWIELFAIKLGWIYVILLLCPL